MQTLLTQNVQMRGKKQVSGFFLSSVSSSVSKYKPMSLKKVTITLKILQSLKGISKIQQLAI